MVVNKLKRDFEVSVQVADVQVKSQRTATGLGRDA
jgi:hypothetical protein